MQDRLIKKLWHTNRKEFIKEFSILQTVNSDGNFEHTYFERNPKTLELERLSGCQIKEVQCTGLKDKNGKLIYEGDIIRIFNECFENRHIVKFGNFAMFDYDFQEDYEKGSTAVYGWYLGGLPLPIPLSISIETSGMQIEIIGNIYKNPELLESEGEECKK